MGEYVKTPESISINSIEQKEFTLSSSQYMELILPNKNFRHVRQFLCRKLTRKDYGIEVGSINYIGKSPYLFLRTKALQSHSYLPEIVPETALPIMPNAFFKQDLREGDLLISKDSNIGEIVILDQDYPTIMTSGAIYRLPVTDGKLYLLAFIKHKIFREQLDFMVPKGATIRHAKTMFLDCKIPMPNKNAESTISYIETLMASIINKEKAIKAKHQKILESIENELNSNQLKNKFNFHFPSLDELENNNRLDATFYSEKHKSLIFPTLNYIGGYKPLDQQGLILKPGPSLEIKLLGTRIDSAVYIDGFYRLITPKQILNNGTLKNYEYIGTPKDIPRIQFGDILFGESGTGRSMVYLDKCDNNTINNAHAHILRPIESECTLNKAITIRCVLQYYKEIGIIDCITVGGAGGHLSPSYFDRVYIPNFPLGVQNQIAELYHNSIIKYDFSATNAIDFLSLDAKFNSEAGITELDKSCKILQKKLDNAIHQIINDQSVPCDFNLNTGVGHL